MTEKHVETFYGQKSGIRLESPSISSPYILVSCINKKENGEWEDISQNEGRTVKLMIEEMICFLEVLYKKSAMWRGYHVFKDYTSLIQIGWEDESRDTLIMKLGENYEKKIKFPNTKFLILLLEHILNEKIEFATSPKKEKGEIQKRLKTEKEYGIFSEHITSKDGLQVVETTIYDLSLGNVTVKAKIRVESPKALLIELESGEELWIPKSAIHSNYDNKSKKKVFQDFVVNQWVIDKNKIR
ncbi:MAG: hypothetical protein ACP6IY_20885 [Promethearchaeia archaeon]